ncbi:MAG: bifunctional (p)ppGpp synthetase/guanosine-3',5'-bis(diphosphate) 3'-pyrophosphohydrolase [Dehalococcoidia bacterium]|nr:bifunctional (p)ppGpp synthetase/guanosine-3',5'-bis(diphosphate) 3'-pyrophosphohydrolase [Dehalococcoidia bacterium]
MLETLMSKAIEYTPTDRLGVIERAYEYAEDAHRGQKRKSGEPFITHPLETAMVLADLKLDADALAAALLHDVVEDSEDILVQDIREQFGEDIARLVDGVTKLTEAELVASGRSSDALAGHTQAETIRKMMMAMARDIRVVLIKLADRLHNMRTIQYLSKAKRIEKAQETLHIYAPLAHRLGIWEMKWQLEDMSFQQTNPQEYKSISRRLNSKRTVREAYINSARDVLQRELDNAHIGAEVFGRPKHIYSIYNKIAKYQSQNKTVDDIHDLFALRVLVNDVQECYTALGVTHTLWRPVPGEFDDYIANPKDNLYQSIHTTVIAEDGHPVEIQVRTHEMHHIAEYGVAAHWLYKEGKPGDESFEQKMVRVRQVVEWQRDLSEDVVGSLRTDIFQNQVFVYTPIGELKELPEGSTPLDFAFSIHTELIFRCIGAKVNGKLVPLTYQLKNGDTCQILTSKTVRGPSLDWLNEDLGYVKTSSARAKVRQWFRRQERSVNIQRGRDLYQRHIRRLTSLQDERVASIMGIASLDHFLAALGDGSISVGQVVNKLSSREEEAEAEVRHQQELGLPISPSAGIQVLGVGDLLTSMARCCNPISGDEIIGYITRVKGVTVHRRNCPNIINEDEPERLVAVSWGKTEVKYPVRIQVRSMDRVGLLRDVTSLVSGENVNIASCVSEEYDDTSIITLTVHVSGIDQLSRLFFKLESVNGVTSVTRSNL